MQDNSPSGLTKTEVLRKHISSTSSNPSPFDNVKITSKTVSINQKLLGIRKRAEHKKKISSISKNAVNSLQTIAEDDVMSEVCDTGEACDNDNSENGRSRLPGDGLSVHTSICSEQGDDGNEHNATGLDSMTTAETNLHSTENPGNKTSEKSDIEISPNKNTLGSEDIWTKPSNMLTSESTKADGLDSSNTSLNKSNNSLSLVCSYSGSDSDASNDT